MIHKIIPSEYKHVDSIEFHGQELYSSYNHNYYINSNTNDLILEVCDDDNGFSYFYVLYDETNNNVDEEYIGFIFSNTGIFDDDTDVTMTDGFIELDDELF